MDLGRPYFYSEGTVSGFDPEEGDELVVGMPVGPGNSGSAVINQQGALVGLLYAGSIIDQEGIDEMDIAHGLCVPIKAIRLFLADYVK
jgi:S1-C subfamily serine protease